jgi:hypothetical protein
MIRPEIVEIESAHSEESLVFLVGLELTIDQKLIAVRLGFFKVQPGRSLIECQGADCRRRYSKLMVQMEPMRLQRLRIFHKQQI